MLDLFADAGGNVIDTANVYTNGSSETIVGDLLKGRRDRFVLATKFTNQTDPGDPNSAGNHRKKIVASLEASLRRLQTDRIDLYYVHARDVLTGVGELMRALDDQVRLGKILYPAVSDWAAWEIAEASSRNPPSMRPYAMMIHCKVLFPMPRSCWIEGSATFTTATSSTTMNCAAHARTRTIFLFVRALIPMMDSFYVSSVPVRVPPGQAPPPCAG